MPRCYKFLPLPLPPIFGNWTATSQLLPTTAARDNSPANKRTFIGQYNGRKMTDRMVVSSLHPAKVNNVMTNRCINCGNEIPGWAQGICYTCARSEKTERRDSDTKHRHRPGQPGTSLRGAASGTPEYPDTDGPMDSTRVWELQTGIWRSDDRSITLNFRDDVYRDIKPDNTRKRGLAVLGIDGNDIGLKIGNQVVKAWVDNRGDLILHRRTMMRFRCLVNRRLFKLCHGCRRLSPAKSRSCLVCGRGWWP